MNTPKKLLTIGGSDSGGAAGIQADLKTFTALHTYGMSALTVVTAQNSVAVQAAHFLSAELVAAQIQAVMSDYGADGIKTGFIGRADLIQTIATTITNFRSAHPSTPLVIDPVLVNHQGQAMFSADVAQSYKTCLFPMATLVTPNRREAELLSGIVVHDLASAKKAGEILINGNRKLPIHQLLIKSIQHKESHLDIFYDGQEWHDLPTPKVTTKNTHGSGDTLSAAILVYLTNGLEMKNAIIKAQQFTHTALNRAFGKQFGSGHGPLIHFEL
jgi:hydroxymethylpyrimidine/phosphomethylpyrimidine kinase